jgi:hypothetical protein
MFKTVCLDFDGVFNTYTGWKGEDELFEPREGLSEFLRKLRDYGYHVVVHSTRPADKIKKWLGDRGLNDLVYAVVDKKPGAVCYVDDRGVRFDGDYEAALQAIKNFKVYWEKDKS